MPVLALRQISILVFHECHSTDLESPRNVDFAHISYIFPRAS